MLEAIEYESEAWMLTRQRTAWSTVDSMSTSANPKARVMLRTVRPGLEAAFDSALTARTRFLGERGYPLPIEGFVTIDRVAREERIGVLVAGSRGDAGEAGVDQPRDLLLREPFVLSRVIEVHGGETSAIDCGAPQPVDPLDRLVQLTPGP